MACKFDPVLSETGERIRTIRKQRNMTQMELAEKVGNDCSKNMISCYENGEKEMGLRRFAAIVEALEVSPSELFERNNDQEKEAGDLFSQLDEENKAMIIKQMQALLFMQKRETEKERFSAR